eukprot:TRINITY_DN105764_c0_g1_i1.p1 TRINITY_DN105764_c0_g1~~TRINITY_DN105764_c0_g1_i1.p1  ORF type:complete len:266 (+),score=23.57 TRINITY_DN105764_c0_g1_i1:164-961(+)
MAAQGSLQHIESNLLELLPGPPLLSCLTLHIAEAIVEAFSVILGMHLAMVQLEPCKISMGLISPPLLVACLKLLWAAALVRYMDASSHCSSMCKDRKLVTCFVRVFIFVSSFFTMLHAIVCLTLTSSYRSSMQAIGIHFLIYISVLLAGFNLSMWLQLTWNHSSMGVEAETLNFEKRCKLERLCRMYKSNAIRFGSFRNDCCRECETETKACAVCLEDFCDSEKVACLYCGHFFHPECINMWILKDWRCPYRCPLEEETRLENRP